MKLTDYALNFLKEHISGDKNITPKLSGLQLVELFNSVGCNDVYVGGMPESLSRNTYVLDRLKKINGTNNLKNLLEIVYSPRHFLLNNDLELNIAIDAVNKIISTEGYHFVLTNGKYSISSKDNFEEDTSSEIVFEELRQRLIDELSKAKFLIWVSVAWFTDKGLFEILKAKRIEGLSVQIIILDDIINTNAGIEYSKGFNTIKFKKYGRFENIMHNKFCIIDLKTVVHGSYNWTIKAQYNKETLDVETNRETAERFAEEFMKLKVEASKQV